MHKHAHHFDKVKFLSTTHSNHIELHDWIETATKICLELIDSGVQGAHKEVRNILHRNNVTLNDGQKCVNFSDCITAISSVSWHQKDKMQSRRIIYDMSHALFHNENNLWAVNAANNFMRKHHLAFDHSSINIRQGKGCFLKLYTSKASKIIPKAIQSATKNAHGEHVANCIHSSRKTNTEKFMHGSITAYIIPNKNRHTQSSCIKSAFCELVKESKSKGMSKQEMMNVIANQFMDNQGPEVEQISEELEEAEVVCSIHSPKVVVVAEQSMQHIMNGPS